MAYPCLMWLTWASLLLSLQVGVSQHLQVQSFVLNSTHFKMPTSIHRQEGKGGWKGSPLQVVSCNATGSGTGFVTDRSERKQKRTRTGSDCI